MLFEQVKTKGLGHNAYVLGCGNGLAVVIDPRRDVEPYVRLLRENGLQLAYVLETHRQEDFEFGSRSLADLTGAKVVAGKHELFGEVDRRLGDGEELKVGTTRFVALDTPGHTPESMSYAAYPEDAGKQCWAVFTGDALFVGSTGRTDLSDPARTAENAGILYDAIHQKIAPLGDQALVCPAHGSGSACGGNISERDQTTIGIEKATNPVFTSGREEFVRMKVDERLPHPPYFAHMEVVNLGGGRAMPGQVGRVLAPADFKKQASAGIVIDIRPPDAFAAAHLQGSYNIWLGGLSTFAGWIASPDTKIFLVADRPGDCPEAIAALARIGIDSVEGMMAEGVEAWREAGLPIEALGATSAAEVHDWTSSGKVYVLDVRDQMEWEEKHIPDAHHVYVGELEKQLPDIPKDAKIVVHCSVGNRSGFAASILRRNGFTKVFNMFGGIKAWEKLGFPLERKEGQGKAP